MRPIDFKKRGGFMRKIKFSELSLSKKIFKILEYICAIISIPFVCVLSLDIFFNDRLLTEFFWSINWYKKGFWLFVTISIFFIIYDIGKWIYKKIKSRSN